MEENTGFMDKLAEDVAEFDVLKFLPKLDTVLGWVDLIARVAILAAPVAILILGLMYYLKPPEEANHQFGYRFYWGMGSIQALTMIGRAPRPDRKASESSSQSARCPTTKTEMSCILLGISSARRERTV